MSSINFYQTPYTKPVDIPLARQLPQKEISSLSSSSDENLELSESFEEPLFQMSPFPGLDIELLPLPRSGYEAMIPNLHDQESNENANLLKIPPKHFSLESSRSDRGSKVSQARMKERKELSPTKKIDKGNVRIKSCAARSLFASKPDNFQLERRPLVSPRPRSLGKENLLKEAVKLPHKHRLERQRVNNESTVQRPIHYDNRMLPGEIFKMDL